jgi:hypothetical protein
LVTLWFKTLRFLILLKVSLCYVRRFSSQLSTSYSGLDNYISEVQSIQSDQSPTVDCFIYSQSVIGQ